MKKTITLVFKNWTNTQSCTTAPIPSSSLIVKTLYAMFLLAGMLFTTVKVGAQAYCTMSCHNLVNVSLPATCEGEITYAMILSNPNNQSVCSPNGPQAFDVTVMNQSNVPIPTSPVVTAAYIGQTLSVKVKHLATGNSCWGSINVEDKLAPQLTCPPDVTVACTAPTDTSATGIATATDCSSFNLSFYNQVQNNACATPFSAVVTRTWIATDAGGYISTCNQKINLLQPTTASVQFPPNRDGVAAPALNCVNPNTTPANTGAPTINGQPIPNGTGYCNMAVSFSDQQIPICQNSYKILRTWTVVTWCTGAILNHVQIIAVKDTTPPTLTCPADLTVGTTSSIVCKASVLLPQAGISDNCSTNFTTTMNTPAGFITGNGGQINNVSLGVYTITYNVTDACGNSASCTNKLTVVDDDAPTVVCDELTVVSLNNLGTATVFAQTFDDGSYDNCGPVTFSVRRMQAGCGTQPVFGPTVKFCCADVGDDVMVEMKATDASGNMNSCMVTVHVNDNNQPSILCPANKTINCTDDPTNLALTGQATGSAPCGTPNITYTDVNNLNMCDVGTITRTWKATSGNGSSTCTQIITSVDNTPVSVTFPPNYSVTGCVSIASLAPANLPAPYNAPVTSSDCELLATNYTDQVFTVSAPACFKIVRTWKVINWCTYVPGGTTGLWQGTQIIMVTDNTPPTFTCPSNMTVGVGQNCKATVTLPQVTNIQDCSQNVTVSVTSSFGSGYGPFLNVAPGNYTATYSVSDGCNNTATCTITIQVKDDKKPTPYCKNGLIIELMGVDTDGDGIIDDGMIQTWASDFNAGSFDNCSGTLKFSFSSNVLDTGAVFNCGNIGQNPIQMWVTDAAGNQAFCQTFLIVQDNMGVCNGPLIASVGGAVANEQGFDVEAVTVTISDGISQPSITGPNGNFSFPAVPMYGDYTVTPAKDTNLLNGVTTYDIVVIRRHILGIEMLPTPYKIIAADINRSNSVTTADLVDLQRAILFINDYFPNNKSWRFVNESYSFPNPANPFQAMFPEVYNINNFSGNMDSVQFVAVKIGDVNDSASPNSFTQPNEDRSGETLMLKAVGQQTEQGREFKVDFTVENFSQIAGYQFTLNFDPGKMELLRVEPGELASLTEANFGFRLLDVGALTTSWNNFEATTMPDGAVLFSLIFQAKSSADLSQSLRISSDYTQAEAYRESGEILDIALEFQLETNKEQPLTINVQVRPNPFRETTVIGFYLPEAREATLGVFDATGRLVKTAQGDFGAGYNEFHLHAGELTGQGTYFYRLQTIDEAVTGKLVLVR
jgi:hypothetical protein